MLLTADMRREQRAGAGFGVGCGCHKDGDSGQGGKSPGGAGLSPFWDRRVQLCLQTPKTGNPIVKWGWKHLWQVTQSLCIVAAGISAHLALGRALMHSHGLLGPAKSVLLIDPRMSTIGPTAPWGDALGRQSSLQPWGEAKGTANPSPEKAAHIKRHSSVKPIQTPF